MNDWLLKTARYDPDLLCDTLFSPTRDGIHRKALKPYVMVIPANIPNENRGIGKKNAKANKGATPPAKLITMRKALYISVLFFGVVFSSRALLSAG
nr:hypothetical protein [Sulfobacillus thermosulfidooxidans]